MKYNERSKKPSRIAVICISIPQEYLLHHKFACVEMTVHTTHEISSVITLIVMFTNTAQTINGLIIYTCRDSQYYDLTLSKSAAISYSSKHKYFIQSTCLKLKQVLQNSYYSLVVRHSYICVIK